MNPISPTSGAMHIATNGIRKAMNHLAGDAQVVASGDVMSRSTVKALIDARQQVLYVKAGARMISASDEAIGNLLDTRA